jgi:hypothetical protein
MSSTILLPWKVAIDCSHVQCYLAALSYNHELTYNLISTFTVAHRFPGDPMRTLVLDRLVRTFRPLKLRLSPFLIMWPNNCYLCILHAHLGPHHLSCHPNVLAPSTSTHFLLLLTSDSDPRHSTPFSLPLSLSFSSLDTPYFTMAPAPMVLVRKFGGFDTCYRIPARRARNYWVSLCPCCYNSKFYWMYIEETLGVCHSNCTSGVSRTRPQYILQTVVGVQCTSACRRKNLRRPHKS